MLHRRSDFKPLKLLKTPPILPTLKPKISRSSFDLDAVKNLNLYIEIASINVNFEQDFTASLQELFHIIAMVKKVIGKKIEYHTDRLHQFFATEMKNLKDEESKAIISNKIEAFAILFNSLLLEIANSAASAAARDGVDGDIFVEKELKRTSLLFSAFLFFFKLYLLKN